LTIVALETLGCKLNQAESESLAAELQGTGYGLASHHEAPDICIVNTCTVTHIADRKSRHLLRLARKLNPKALVVATGCYAQRSPQALAGLGADLVMGNDEKPRLLRRLLELRPPQSDQPSHGRWPRTRSLVKIQDGCDSFCTYCIVPEVRGRERSRPPEDILADIQAKEAQGYREVILTGTKVGCYRFDGWGLRELLEQVLAQSRIERLRLSSLQPQELTPALLRLWQNPRLCRHIHLPLQSGSDAVLRRMGRGYSTADFKEAVARCRSQIPDIAITTDIMVGFPGETAAEFEASYDLCREAGFAAIHVFPYSARAGTPAADMPGQVEAAIKRNRALLMLELGQESLARFQARFLGRRREVLWEREISPGLWTGRTDNYMRVLAESRHNLSNRLMSVLLHTLKDGHLWGQVD